MSFLQLMKAIVPEVEKLFKECFADIHEQEFWETING